MNIGWQDHRANIAAFQIEKGGRSSKNSTKKYAVFKEVKMAFLKINQIPFWVQMHQIKMQKFLTILAILPIIFMPSIFGQSVEDKLNNGVAPNLGPLPAAASNPDYSAGPADSMIPSENSRRKRAVNRKDPNGFQQFLDSNPQLKSLLKDLVAGGDKHLSTAFEKLTARLPPKSSTPPPGDAPTTSQSASSPSTTSPSPSTSPTTPSTSSSKPSSTSAKPPNDAEVMKQFMAFSILDMAKGFFSKPGAKGGAKN